jgi:hypothetical protein
MKTIIPVLIIIIFSLGLMAQTQDYLLKKDFQVEKKRLNDNISNLKKLNAMQANSIDSLTALNASVLAALQIQSDSLKSQSASLVDLQSRSGKNKKQADSFYFYLIGLLFILIILFSLVQVTIKRTKAALKLEIADLEQLFSSRIAQETGVYASAMKAHQEAVSVDLSELKSRLVHVTAGFESKQNELSASQKSLLDKTGEEFAGMYKALAALEGSIHKSNQNFEEGIGILRGMIETKLNEIDLKIAKTDQKKHG